MSRLLINQGVVRRSIGIELGQRQMKELYDGERLTEPKTKQNVRRSEYRHGFSIN